MSTRAWKGISSRRTRCSVERERVRTILAESAPTITLLAAQVANSAVGIDPEASAVYLRELSDVCDSALRALHA